MSRNRLMTVLGLLVAISMILTACGPKPTPPATAAPATATEPPVVPVTTRHGGWLDEIVVSVVAKDSAVTQLNAGAIDVYADSLSSGDFPTIQEAGLKYAKFNGLYYDIMYNPVGPEFNNGKLNPFSSRKVREATNWLYDRDYINQEIYGGGSLPKYLPIVTQFPDYADLADVARRLEAKYAYNPQKADEVISAEMTAMGATKGADGKWQYKGEPVTLIFLIRPDSDGTRKPLGDYVANQLESIGFTVDRQYKKSSEASPIWQGSDPMEGQWNLYTAAWSATRISRDQKTIFQEMFLNTSLQGVQPFLSNVADPVFQKLGDDLANANYTTMEQRREMMATALELSLQDSMQVWLIDGKSYAPFRNDMVLTYDLAAGIQGSDIWPYTTRFIGQEGGQLKWASSDLFTEPWNPIGGSNWSWDQAIIRATMSGGMLNDPYTGLGWPLRAERAEVVMKTGLPAVTTLDWVTLSYADEIKVPADAWVDWDAAAQKFVTAAEKAPEGITAKSKTVVYYPADLFETVKWHDGSSITMGDFIMGLIMNFDRAKTESAIFDEQAVPYYDSFMMAFKGIKVTSTSPLTVEYYSDDFYQDAELTANAQTITTLWPEYTFAEGSWPIIAIANQAEAAGELAYSDEKSTSLEIDRTSFVGGPSMAILNKYLDQAIAEKFIPYAATLGQYITADEAAARYANLKTWYANHNHFWVGTGPYYLDKVFLTEKTATLKNFADYPDTADRWAGFGEPRIAVVSLDGPGQVKIGGEATFDVFATFKDAPYPTADIKVVKYLLYNAKGDVVKIGQAEAVADGQYRIVLTADVTSALEAGANKLEVAVVPLVVSVPTFTSLEFVSAP